MTVHFATFHEYLIDAREGVGILLALFVHVAQVHNTTLRFAFTSHGKTRRTPGAIAGFEFSCLEPILCDLFHGAQPFTTHRHAALLFWLRRGFEIDLCLAVRPSDWRGWGGCFPTGRSGSPRGALLGVGPPAVAVHPIPPPGVDGSYRCCVLRVLLSMNFVHLAFAQPILPSAS